MSRVSQSCYKLKFVARLRAPPPRPGSRTFRLPPAARRARGWPVGWRLPCPSPVTKSLSVPADPSVAGSLHDPLAFVRYLDVVVVVLAAPFVVLLGAPVLGYVVGAAAWIVQRVVGRRGRAPGRAQPTTSQTAARPEHRRHWSYAPGSSALPSWPSASSATARTASRRRITCSSRSPSTSPPSLIIRPLGEEVATLMKTRNKILLGVGGVYLAVDHRDRRDLRLHAARQRRVPAAERVQARHLGQPAGPLDINKAVLYLFIAGDPHVRRRWSRSPGACRRARTACRPRSRSLYALMRDNITRGNMDDKMAAQVVPVHRARCSCSSGSRT